ncbi:MAG: polysaccharide deacetylase family protein, partial [Bacteroidota bacterium]
MSLTPRRKLTLAPALLLGLLLCPLPARASAVTDGLREGCRLLVGGRFDQAGKAFREAGQQDVSCLEALVGEGTAYLLAGYQDAAADCFSRAVILDPDSATALVGKGTAAVAGRQYEAALDDYRQAVGLNPAHAGAVRASEAQVACLLGLYEIAETEARQALVEAPQNELARQVLAAALIARNRPSEALQAMSAPVDGLSDGALGIVAPSPLFIPSARYYIQNNLDDNQRLAALKPGGIGPAQGGDGTPTVQTVFNRGDNAFHIEWPKPGAKVNGKFEVAVFAAQDAGVQYVAVLIDEQFGGMSNASPFRIYVDSALAREGLREIRVDGYGEDGSIVKTATIMVNVANGQHVVGEEEKAIRSQVRDFLQGLLVLRAHPLLRAQLAGHALQQQGRLQEAVDAFEYAFSYEPTLPCIRADLILCYRKLGLLDAIAEHEIHSLPRQDCVALTFDDGPNPIMTPWILDLLDKYQAKATFLLVGKQVEMYPELTREILRRGHEIGAHSYTHSNMRQISNLGVERELVMTRQLIRRACGEFVTLFRPPGGNYDPQVREAVMSTGFSTVFWTENITSYPGQSGPEILPKMLNKID